MELRIALHPTATLIQKHVAGYFLTETKTDL